MEKKYIYGIVGAILIISVIASAYLLQQRIFPAEFERMVEEKQLKEMVTEKVELRMKEKVQELKLTFGFDVLTGEQAENAKTIAQSDEMLHAVLQVMGDTEVEVYKGPVDRIAVLRYSSQNQWMLQATVDLEIGRVDSIMLTRGVAPLVFDPKKLVQIAEQEFPAKEFGVPYLKKVVQKGENGEVVFLTDKGTVTVRIDMEAGKILALQKEPVKPYFLWGWLILILGIVVSAIILFVVWGRKGKKTTEGEEIQSEQAEGGIGESGEKSEGGNGENTL